MELKKCPFCGEIPYIEKKPLWKTYNGTTHGYYGCFEYDIRCHKCGCNILLVAMIQFTEQTKKLRKTQQKSGIKGHKINKGA